MMKITELFKPSLFPSEYKEILEYPKKLGDDLASSLSKVEEKLSHDSFELLKKNTLNSIDTRYLTPMLEHSLTPKS